MLGVGSGTVKLRWIWAMVALAAAGAAPQAVADVGEPMVLTALTKLEPGQWDLRARDPGAVSMQLCIRDLEELLQLRHQGQICSRFVVENQPSRLSVTYSCPRTGHGRTDLKVETPRLAQITTQGIANGLPFSWIFEGRRTGACMASSGR